MRFDRTSSTRNPDRNFAAPEKLIDPGLRPRVSGMEKRSVAAVAVRRASDELPVDRARFRRTFRPGKWWRRQQTPPNVKYRLTAGAGNITAGKIQHRSWRPTGPFWRIGYQAMVKAWVATNVPLTHINFVVKAGAAGTTRRSGNFTTTGWKSIPPGSRSCLAMPGGFMVELAQARRCRRAEDRTALPSILGHNGRFCPVNLTSSFNWRPGPRALCW